MVNISMMKPRIPGCCGREMNVQMDLGRFWEAHCDVCGDVVYLKKTETPKPHMIDD